MRSEDVRAAIVEIGRGEPGLGFLTVILAIVAIFVTIVAVGIILLMRKAA